MSVQYKYLLKLPKWQKIRYRVMELRQWKCECCGEDEAPLQVHHLDYLPQTSPWEYPEEWLEVLCEKCHKWRELFNAIFGRSLASTVECKRLVSFFSRHVKPTLDSHMKLSRKRDRRLARIGDSDDTLSALFAELTNREKSITPTERI